MSGLTDALVAHCRAKPGATPGEQDDFKLLGGFLDTFARFYRNDDPPAMMVRCPDDVRRRLAASHAGVVVSERMHWETVGWTWTDVPVDGSIPVETLIGLIETSHDLLYDDLDEPRRFLIQLLARGATPAEALAALIENAGLEGRRGEIEGLARPAFAIITNAPRDDEPPIGTTRIGGRPDLGDSTEWPRYEDGRPMTFLAQINLAELPEGADRGPLPPAGLLSIFSAWGWQVEDDADPHPPEGDPTPDWTRIVYAEDPSTLTRSPTPEGLNEFPAAPGEPVPIIALPSSAEEPAVKALEWDEETWNAFYEAVLNPFTFLQAMTIGRPLDSKLLGYADFIQDFDPAADDGRSLLFQLGSDDQAAMCWGDGGCLYFFADPEGLARGDFSRIHSAFQCG
ncbi:DUF1963 domain-containing protein [Planctomyces sp. SH-PL62]|uniref:DUF1963 domain-containing protein n=1 Tax=Planctomyces sp. SH-PL62 TaxID=1636152 RepID=UPI00078C6590|nr:DUF1963 domain-containing protein [Planctomyces sp. SH-PL62]AMV37536.1 hypothetical protein VT85_08875 [Planctomyces sp. SH-PL62]